MAWRTLAKILALFGAFVLAPTAFAQRDDWRACNQYNQYGQNAYYYCNQDSRCDWDGRRCVAARDPYLTRCENIQDAYQCQRQGCTWDRFYGCSSRPTGRDLWECNARDSGWEEHWGGHRAQGYSQAQARNEALRICQRPYGPHDRCVIQSCERVR